MSSSARWPLSLLGAIAVLVFAGSALGFCRTTTCSRDGTGDTPCEVVDGCYVGGEPLYWSGRCVSFSVQEDGSSRRNISYNQVFDVVRASLELWTSADCAGEHPSLEFSPTEPVTCDEQTYNQQGPNANLWVFRDDAWPHESIDLALTTATFNLDTGEIYDADVEINTYHNELTLTGDGTGYDLASVLNHEAGHVIGLEHSTDPESIMLPRFEGGSAVLHALAADDVAGVCEVYPPGRQTGACDPEPRHGFSTECDFPAEDGCGCVTPAVADRPHAWVYASFLAGLVAALRYSRRTRRAGRSRQSV